MEGIGGFKPVAWKHQWNTLIHQSSLALPLGCGRSPRWVLRGEKSYLRMFLLLDFIATKIQVASPSTWERKKTVTRREPSDGFV